MTRSGVVVSNKTEKTVVVRVERVFQHTLYDRTVKQSKKLMAHDESNELKIGDKVKIVESRPLSSANAGPSLKSSRKQENKP